MIMLLGKKFTEVVVTMIDLISEIDLEVAEMEVDFE